MKREEQRSEKNETVRHSKCKRRRKIEIIVPRVHFDRGGGKEKRKEKKIESHLYMRIE